MKNPANNMRESDCDLSWKKKAAGGKELRREYEVGQEIGSGGFAKVYLGMHLESFQKVAVKSYTLASLPEAYLPALSREVSILQRLSHPNCIHLRELLSTPSHLHLILEYAPGGTLFHLIKSSGPQPEPQAKRLFSDLVLAVQHCHRKGIAHRDIKPENVVLTKDGTAKLTDFGLAISSKKTKSRVGTVVYMPPEYSHKEVEYDSFKADIWGLGVVLHYILTGKRVVLKDGGVYIRGNSLVSPLVKVLLARLLSIRPELRPDIEEVAENAWLQGGFEVCIA